MKTKLIDIEFEEHKEPKIIKKKEIKKYSERPKVKFHNQKKVLKDTRTPSFPSSDYDLKLKELELRILENQILLQKLQKEDSSGNKEVEKKEDIVEEGSQQEKRQENLFPVPVEKKRFLFFKKKQKVQENKSIQSVSPQFPIEEISSPDNILLKENNLESIKRCPRCNSKIKKSKVFYEGSDLIQVFKCKNKSCDFVKKFNFKEKK